MSSERRIADLHEVGRAQGQIPRQAVSRRFSDFSLQDLFPRKTLICLTELLVQTDNC